MSPDSGPAPYSYPPDADTVLDLTGHVVAILDGYAEPSELVATSWVRERSELVLTVRGHVAAAALAEELRLSRSGGMQWVGSWEGLNVTVHCPLPSPGRAGFGRPRGVEL